MSSNPVESPKALLFFDALKAAAVLVFLGSIAFLATGHAAWLGGLWIAAGWIAVNAFFLHRILLDVMSGKMPDKKKIYLVLLVKFPVLYLAGFLALYFGWARLEGVAAAFTAYLAACACLAAARRIKRKPS